MMQQANPSSKQIFDVLQEVLGLPGPSGHEEKVRSWLRERWKAKTSMWQEDKVGNILCCLGGKGAKLVIVTHMDEIGFVVRAISRDGFLFVDSAQEGRGVSPAQRYMIGQVAQIIGRQGVVAEGIFAATSGHVLTKTQVEKPHLDYDDFYIDIGAKSRAEAEEWGVHIGAAVIWQWPLRRFSTRLVGKAMDARMLIGIMDILLSQVELGSLQYEVWLGAVIQEENGLHGGRAIARRKTFDAAIGLDVGLVGDIPTMSAREYTSFLGGGPTLVHKDMETHYDTRLLWKMADVARANSIPFQHGVYNSYASDASAFIDCGVPAILVTVPTRYTHTAFEMVEEADIVMTINLLKAFLTTPSTP